MQHSGHNLCCSTWQLMPHCRIHTDPGANSSAYPWRNAYTPTAVDTQHNQITLITESGLVHASVNASGEVKLIGEHRAA